MSNKTSTTPIVTMSHTMDNKEFYTSQVHAAPFYVYYDGMTHLDHSLAGAGGVVWSPQYPILTATPYTGAVSQPPVLEEQQPHDVSCQEHLSTQAADSDASSDGYVEQVEALAASVQQLTMTPHRTLADPVSSYAFLPTPPYVPYPPSPPFGVVSPRSSETFSPHSTHIMVPPTAYSDTDSQEDVNEQNVYVRGLSPLTTDETFSKLCSRFGKLTTCKAILDLRTNECKGFGFAMFETRQEANKAITGFLKLGYQASYAKASATPSEGQESFNTRLQNLQDTESTNIYLSNLPLSFDEEALIALIGSPKEIVSYKILRDKVTLSSRGVGFVKVGSRALAERVIEALHGKKIPGSNHPLQVRFADSMAQKKLKNDVARRKRMEHIKYMPMDYSYLIPNGMMTPYVYYMPDMMAYAE